VRAINAVYEVKLRDTLTVAMRDTLTSVDLVN
jgi:hypothetical protein